MTTALRPMTTGQVLDRTFQLYRNNFLLFVTIAALPPALMMLAQLAQVSFFAVGVQGVAFSSAALVAGGITMLVGFIAWFIGLAFSQAATVQAVSKIHTGATSTVSEAYSSLKGRRWRVLDVIFSVGLRVGGATLGIMLAAVSTGLIITLIPGLGTNAAATVAVGIFAVVIAIGGAWLAVSFFVRYSLAVPACIVEDVKARTALQRSATLTKGSRSRILAIWTVLFLLTWVMSVALSVPVAIAFAMTGNAASPYAQVANAVASFVAGALAGPVVTIAMVLVYYDERVRKEAFDIDLLLSQSGSQAQVAPATP